MKILKEKIPNKTDSLFYDKIAEHICSDGTEIYVETCGEINIEYKGESYNKGHIWKILDKLNDDIINDQDPKSKFRFINNDWFSVFINLPIKDEYIDTYEVAHDYDSAISLLQDAIKDYESGKYDSSIQRCSVN